MPFKSHKQMSYLKHNEPKVYHKWMKKYGKTIVDGKKKESENRTLLTK